MKAKEVFEEWQNANNLPDYLKDQLDTLGKDEKWIEDAFGQDINFGTAGMTLSFLIYIINNKRHAHLNMSFYPYFIKN